MCVITIILWEWNRSKATSCNTYPPWMLGAAHGMQHLSTMNAGSSTWLLLQSLFCLVIWLSCSQGLNPLWNFVEDFWKVFLILSHVMPSVLFSKRENKALCWADSQDIHQAVVGTQIQTHPAEDYRWAGDSVLQSHRTHRERSGESKSRLALGSAPPRASL